MVNAEWGANVTGGVHCTNEPLSEAHPAGRGLQGLSTSGPVVLYDETFESLLFAPMDNYKSAVHYARRPHAVWEAGVTSELTSLPRGFEHRTMLFTGRGITATLDGWGQLVRKLQGTDRSLAERDLNLQYLSYWTDNGAYYSGGNWGEAGGGGAVVNEGAFRAVSAGLADLGIDEAVRIWQLDDCTPGPGLEPSAAQVVGACRPRVRPPRLGAQGGTTRRRGVSTARACPIGRCRSGPSPPGLAASAPPSASRGCCTSPSGARRMCTRTSSVGCTASTRTTRSSSSPSLTLTTRPPSTVLS